MLLSLVWDLWREVDTNHRGSRVPPMDRRGLKLPRMTGEWHSLQRMRQMLQKTHLYSQGLETGLQRKAQLDSCSARWACVAIADLGRLGLLLWPAELEPRSAGGVGSPTFLTFQ